MLSKNNFNEKIRQMDEKKERFSIRKLTVGAASVLIGLIFIGVGGQTVHADTVPATQTEAVATKAATTDDTTTTSTDDSAAKAATETSSTKETDAQTQSTTTQVSAQTSSSDAKTTAPETEVKTETETTEKAEKDLTKTTADAETAKTGTEDTTTPKTETDAKAEETTTLKTNQKAAPAKDLAAQKTVTPAQNNYNTADWDGSLDNTTHEYTLTGYHGENKEDIYIPNTNDFIKAGTISDTDKVYITKDLIQTITKAGATSITIDDQGADDKNKVYAKGDWSNGFASSSTLKKVDLSHLDASGVTNMNNMFFNDSNLESVNLSGTKFGNVASANAVFYQDPKLTTVNMSGTDLSHVNGANAWFGTDSALTNLDFSNVTFPDEITNIFIYADNNNLKNVNLTGAKNVPVDFLKAYVKAVGNSGATSIDLRGFNFDKVTDLSSWFASMPNVKSIDLSGVDLSHVTNVDDMFYNDPNLESINLSGVKFGNVTNANAVFFKDPKLTNLDMSNVDLTNVHGINAWFSGADNLANINFSNTTFPEAFTDIPTAKLTSVNITGAKNIPAGLLKAYVKALGNSGATTIDLRGFDFNKVTDLSNWFANMPSVKSIDLSGVDLSHVTNINDMFYNDPNLESVNLSGAKFGNITTANSVFNSDPKLTTVNMSGTDLSQVHGANAWFSGDSALTDLDFSNVTFPAELTNTFLYANNDNLKNVNLAGAKNVTADFLRAYVKALGNSGATLIDLSGNNFTINKESLTDLSSLFANMPNLKEVNVTGLVTDKVENVSRMFYNDSALTTIVGLDTWDTSNVTDMSYIFASFTNPTTDNHKPQGLEHTGSLKALDLSGWKTSNVTNMACMFTGQNHLETLKGLSNWNTSKVTNMAQMFHGLSKLQDGSLGDLSKWDTSNVTDMTYMFAVMSLQTDLSFVNGWKTGMVTDMSYMFAKDEKLQKLDLSNWDVSSVGLKETEQNYSFGAMFSGDTALTSVGDISHWRTDNVHDTRQMFYGTTSLKNIDLSGWNTGKLQIAEGMFRNSGAQYINLDHWDFSNIKRLDDYGFVKAQGELSGVENMFADLTNNAVIKMDGIVLPDANTVFVVTDFRGYHPIAVIANGKNGESLADLVKLNKQTWTDKNNQTVLGRQNTNKLVFFDADDLTKKVGIEGLNFIFDSEKDLADQFNTAIGEDAVKKAIGSLASKWDVQRDTENGKLKPDIRLDNAPVHITPAAFVALLALNSDPTEEIPEEVPRDIAMVYAQYKLHFIKDSNPGSGTTSDEKPNPDNHPTDNNGKNDDHHGDNVAPHGENKPQANHKKDDKKESKTISPKAMEKAKNNRGSVKKLGAVKTATKNNVVKAATKTAPKVENTLPQTGEKQNNLVLFGLGLLSLLGLGSLVDRKRRN
ncbi:BspA family leucine-rich repeat surface protein [Lactobacillus amylovorus]|uniref:BspA family leucine-rich repeat surface protein n=1 Tax=Lactobacillus amylovorus TaxID=1604 RepID=UPI00232FF356|nr:BspA family leucine-rich repeat surface protein [Lactobacillus amylovorus]MDB6254794.1 BspA family leucine-rich repeat surface protein [Lactobacillus amylovorus]